MNSYYNVFIGTENGLLKGINAFTRSFSNLNNLSNLSKEKEIVAMCWADISKQDKIYFATRDQHIVKFDTNLEVEVPFNVLTKLNAGNGLIKGLELLSENELITCTEDGLLKIWKIENAENESFFVIEREIKVGSNISCMKKWSPTNSESNNSDCLIATGGKDNDLKVWNLKNPNQQENIFRAKNVSDNWIQLKEPIWITAIDFINETRIVVGTAYHQIRVYDIKSGIRRPIYNLKYGLSPITEISILPDNSNRLIASNTHGEMQMIDLTVQNDKNDQCKTIKKYRNFQGSIKSMQIIIQTKEFFIKNTLSTKTSILIATCGLDRYLRVHDAETSALVSKVYLKSRLNCLLFSKYDPIKLEITNNNRKLEEDELSNINSESLATEDLWSDMETIFENNLKSKRKLKTSEKNKNDFYSENEEKNYSEFKKTKIE